MIQPAPTSLRLDLLGGITECLTPEVARRIVDYRFDAPAQAKLSDLASRSNEGTLSPAERDEYLYYVEVIDFIGILKAKARKVLASSRMS
jgi:hypothetical protein